MAVNYAKQAEAILNSQDKGNSDLLILMYGSLVTQVVRDVENVDTANAELERLGHDTGIRLVEDFVSRSSLSVCQSFKDTCEIIAKVAFKVYLGVAAEVRQASDSVCFITLPVNPITDFVEIPPALAGLNYNAYVCGVIQSALEQLCLRTCLRAPTPLMYVFIIGAAQSDLRGD
ncbi:putative trafficking particle complex subunit 3 [Gregarina niphandrodes]|uniref:Trafficking particle complex subunit 3 n=1 Tax=Gregarina niphandrodes TaxID=110365 RepID=A0A023B351_GRENI|nr:putative trafficking particle complex subunit 3 [Gregarina niphandrodes]EZG55369.1 putative trafficking particle complex subunit 3 [Gregarina niphandrodes]|eukprot:XP_011131616.1 putative trafficking particle complex subunit 3 [Gregarina niphandrodes]